VFVANNFVYFRKKRRESLH